jgi:hypothetical protein
MTTGIKIHCKSREACQSCITHSNSSRAVNRERFLISPKEGAIAVRSTAPPEPRVSTPLSDYPERKGRMGLLAISQAWLRGPPGRRNNRSYEESRNARGDRSEPARATECNTSAIGKD